MGYDKDNSAERLLIYGFVTEWVETDLNYFLTEDDYNVLNRLIRMISDTCLLPYKTYCTNRMVMGCFIFLISNILQNTSQNFFLEWMK